MIVSLVVACAMFMTNVDGSAIATALPDMAQSLGSTPAHMSLAITSYMLSLAVFIPISGWMADRYGARTVFQGAIAVFTLASIWCGLCHSEMELTVARLVQGIGGAMMTPVGRLVVFRTVPKSDVVRAMSYITVPAFVGPIIGPPLGGFITTYLDWRWIFYINVPIGILGIVLAGIYFQNFRSEEKRPLDWIGFILSGGSLTGLVYGLEMVGRREGGWEVYLLLGGSLIAVLLAVLHSLRHPTPLIDLSLMKFPTFRVSQDGGTFFRTAVGAIIFLLPLLFQVGFGMNAFQSGLITLSTAIGAVCAKTVIQYNLRWFGYRRVLVWNGVACALSIVVCGFFTEATPAALLMAVLILGGVIRSTQHSALNTIVFAEVPPQRLASATSFSSMVQQLANGLGVAMAAILLQISMIWRGVEAEAMNASDIRFALFASGACAALAVLFYLSLAPDAAADISGHRKKGEAATR